MLSCWPLGRSRCACLYDSVTTVLELYKKFWFICGWELWSGVVACLLGTELGMFEFTLLLY